MCHSGGECDILVLPVKLLMGKMVLQCLKVLQGTAKKPDSLNKGCAAKCVPVPHTQMYSISFMIQHFRAE